MEAIILAGGQGTRLRSVISDLPKPMAPVGGRPFLEILLDKLVENGFAHVVLSLGYKANIISAYFGKNFRGMSISYVVEETALGTGGGVRLAMEQAREDHVFILNGDTYLDRNTEELEQAWQRFKAPIVVGCEVADTSRYGRLVLDKDRVVGFSEKGVDGRGLINAGCYVLPRHELDAWKAGEKFSFENDYLNEAVRRKMIRVFVTKGRFIDIGVPEDYARAQTELAV